VFFLLSSFLLTELLLREKSRTGTVHVGSFYVRRILRIWPLYFAALGVGFILTAPLSAANRPSWMDLIWYGMLMGNWRAATHGFLPLGMGLLWSIAVEEQFYLVWPWIVKAASRRGIFALSILFWLVSQLAVVILCLWKVPFGPGISANTFADLQYFALGSGISAFLAGRIPTWPGVYRGLLMGMGFVVFVIAGVLLFYLHATSLPYVFPALLLAGVAAVMLFFSLYGVRLSRRAAPSVYLGKISYGLYVVHFWIWILVGAALGIKPFSARPGGPLQYLISIPILFAAAILSYHYFESPFLKLKSRFEFVKSRAV
jgi:peptidoglycan/LPS O-acetylase OafA/YrhL